MAAKKSQGKKKKRFTKQGKPIVKNNAKTTGVTLGYLQNDLPNPIPYDGN